MGKGKLAKFAALEHYDNVFQYSYGMLSQEPFPLRGRWREYFHNDNPIVVELGCGKGEYTVGLAAQQPHKNFIGVDIKGARLYTGATQALTQQLGNVAFLRTNIEIIDLFFGEGEVEEIWLTFADPQMKNPRKRLTSSYFLRRYRRILIDNGVIHLKTDSNFLLTYTQHVVNVNALPQILCTADLYGNPLPDDTLQSILHIRTYYEQMWLDRGIKIKYISFRLPQKGDLVEPNIEIERDDYRSYHRPQGNS